MTDETQRMNAFKAMFPNASQSTVAVNPHLVAPNGGSGNKNESTGILKRKRGKMTGVEKEFVLILEARKRAGEILRYEYQGMTLRWGVDEKTGDSMKYTADFVVLDDAFKDGAWKIKLIEVKDEHIHYRQQAIARFKGCRAWWPELSFEMWQRQKNHEWKRIY